MTDPDRENVLAAASSLEHSMSDLGADIKSLREYGQRSRHWIWALAVSLTLDVVLSVFLGFVAVQANHASNKATDATSAAHVNRQTQVTTCEATNQARAVSTQLWTYVIGVVTANNTQLTAAQRAQLVMLRTHIRTAYAPRDCSPDALSKSTAPPTH